MSKGGQMQHPEVVGMYPEEYPLLIEKGFDFLVETVIPRQHKNLSLEDPIKRSTALEMGKTALLNDTMSFIRFIRNCCRNLAIIPEAPWVPLRSQRLRWTLLLIS